MYIEDKFAERLIELRTAKGVSARDMSLSLGQGAGYINNIESKRNLPSMTAFFYICEYLEITPYEFFEFTNAPKLKYFKINRCLKQLNDSQLEHLTAIVEDLVK